MRVLVAVLGFIALAGALAAPAPPNAWPLSAGLGGAAGDTLLALALNPLVVFSAPEPRWIAGAAFAAISLLTFAFVAPVWRRREPGVAVPAQPAVKTEKAAKRERRAAPVVDLDA